MGPLLILSIVNWLTKMTYIPFKEQRRTDEPASSSLDSPYSPALCKTSLFAKWALTRLTLQPQRRKNTLKRQFEVLEENLVNSFGFGLSHFVFYFRIDPSVS